MNVTMLVYILIAANVLFSWQAFSNQALFENFKFRVGNILSGKEYVRLLSSAFLHADWTHLIVNMIALYSFGIAMGYSINTIQFAALYFVSLFAGNLLALFFNKGNFNYSAVGASGAVSGVVFCQCFILSLWKSIVVLFPSHAQLGLWNFVFALFCLRYE